MINIVLNTMYHIVIFKLKLKTYNDTVINICDCLVDHSYIFVKVIQWGIQNVYHLNFDDELKKYFNTFSNNVPYTTLEKEKANVCIHHAIQYASTYNDNLIIENNYIPINSGSVALVYKARLNDKPVIIKVLRHNIKDTIKEDLYFLEYFFNNTLVNTIIKYYTNINFKTFIQNNRDILLNQCDFVCEVNHALLFKNIIKHKINIVIPYVYKHFTDVYNEIIIMEYLDGPVAKNIPPSQLVNHFKILRIFYLESIFKYKIIHGDFHLGNIIIIDENTIGIIDFGIVYTIPDEISNKVFDILILNTNRKDIKYLLYGISIFIKMICVNKKKHKELFIKIKNDHELINFFLNSKFSGGVLVASLNKIMSMDGVELNIDMCNSLLALMSSLQTLDNGVSLIDDDNKSLTTIIKSYTKKI